MYKKSFSNNRPYSNNRPQFSGRRFPAARRVKTMDASLINRMMPQLAPVAEHVTKNQFANLPISEKIRQNILDKGYTTPTPIQDEVIPYVLQGRDVVGIANTGTGKTAAFLIPLINKIVFNNSEKVLIVVPTRELAVQIEDECRLFSKGLNIYSVICIGGINISRQVNGLRRNPQIVIGTPGRLKDLKNQGKLNIASFNNIVLDEVDRMLDMGFIRDVTFIMSHLPRTRQSLFFSATLNPTITTIIKTFANNPVNISVKSQETTANVEQKVIKTMGKNKIDMLHDLLIQEGFDKVLVFGRTKWGVEKLSKQLMFRGFKVAALHGNKNQNQRQRALDEFRENRIKILLATDVVARGIDVDDVTHVINFDLPESYDDYVHRIGRTGRNDKKGIAYTFVD